MADPTPLSEALEWMNRVWGFIVGVVMTILGMTSWLVPKFKSVNARIDSVEDEAHCQNDELAAEMHNRVTNTEKLIVELGAIQKAHIDTYKGLRDDLQALASKTDEQTKVLNQVVGELKASRTGRMP